MFLINKMNSTPLLLWALLNTTKLVVARFPLLSHKSFSLEAIALRLSRFFVKSLKKVFFFFSSVLKKRNTWLRAGVSMDVRQKSGVYTETRSTNAVQYLKN